MAAERREGGLRLGGFALAVVTTLIMLTLFEVGLRLFRPVSYRDPGRRLSPAEEAVHRASDIPGLLFELAPNRTKIFGSNRFFTNSLGLRDDEPIPRGPGVARIAAIGDSFTFGMSHVNMDTYPSKLELFLNRATEPHGIRVDVLNFGVSGYSSEQEAIALEHKVLPLDPDVILVGYVMNDPEIDPILPIHAHFSPVAWWQHFHVARLVAFGANQLDRRRWGDGRYAQYLHNEPRKWGSVLDAFERFAAAGRERNIPVILVMFPYPPPESWDEYNYSSIHEKVGEAARSAGLEVVDLFARYQRYDPARLRFSKQDPHPSSYCNRVIADSLKSYLLQSHGAALGLPGRSDAH